MSDWGTRRQEKVLIAACMQGGKILELQRNSAEEKNYRHFEVIAYVSVSYLINDLSVSSIGNIFP